MRSLKPNTINAVRPTTVHSYGFVKHRSAVDLVSLLRQLLTDADTWNHQIEITGQDVEWAFDNMQHNHWAMAQARRGTHPGIVRAHLQELQGFNS